MVAAVCVMVLAATYQDLARLTGGRYTGSDTWGSPGWPILVYGMMLAGTLTFGWFLWSGFRQPRSG
jgi:hypothetical protein